VLAINPDFPEALFNLSNLLIATRRLAEAEDLVRHMLRLRPESANAHFNLGCICDATGREREAELAYRAALRLDPRLAGPANNLGLLLHRVGRLAEAEMSYREALRIDSGHAHAWNNLGNLLAELKRPAEAFRAYEKAVTLDPDYSHATGKLLLSSRQLCEWSRISAIEDRIGAMATQGKRGLAPFEMLIVPALTGADHRRVARLYAEGVHEATLSLPAIVPGTRRPCGRLRIGYLSSDYCEHATTHLLAGVLEAHDPARAEVFCYSTGRPTLDGARRRIIKACGIFRDFHGVSDEAAARMIAADGIDFLVDLKGYTESARLGIQARRPAPVVVSWLGYPGTLGEPRLADYIIGDPVVTPLEMAGDYSETLALLPHCYQPNDNTRPIGPRITRAQAGLPDDALVLCNFNASYKISPAMFSLWLQVLRQVPDSVLWLLHTSPEVVDNLQREAARHCIAPQRLVFATRLPLAEHLGRLQLADLAVDTFPYTSHTTGSDALWAGVPLATKIGSTFVSRVAASLVSNVGLPELIATNDQDYLALLLGLARDRDRLRKVRERLANSRPSCPLFDTKRFASDLLDLYETIRRQELRGERKPIQLSA
jgi:predicted O-linked N-acetylglucosamine transferase (SPINDLY family)